MQDFAGRTAVIAGGASGIGLAVAQHRAREGMNLVLGDIEQPALNRVVAEFEAADMAMSEILSPETADSNLGVAVLCPGFVISKIAENVPLSWTI